MKHSNILSDNCYRNTHPTSASNLTEKYSYSETCFLILLRVQDQTAWRCVFIYIHEYDPCITITSYLHISDGERTTVTLTEMAALNSFILFCLSFRERYVSRKINQKASQFRSVEYISPSRFLKSKWLKNREIKNAIRIERIRCYHAVLKISMQIAHKKLKICTLKYILSVVGFLKYDLIWVKFESIYILKSFNFKGHYFFEMQSIKI